MRPVSYSGLQLYASCPSAFWRRYVVGEPGGSPPTAEEAPAMYRGTRIHNEIEKFLDGKTEDLPGEAEFYRGFLNTIRDNAVMPELGWAFNKDWEASNFHNDDTTRIRGFLDAVSITEDTCHIYEWKTGKVYKDHADQRSLYGLAGALIFPFCEEIRVTTVYLDQRKNWDTIYQQATINSMKWVWDRRIDQAFAPQKYPKRASWKCKSCMYNVTNGGKCVAPPQKGRYGG